MEPRQELHLAVRIGRISNGYKQEGRLEGGQASPESKDSKVCEGSSSKRPRPDAEEEREVMAERVLYTRPDGKWAWRLKADNGQIIATDGGQGHNNVADRIIGGEFKHAVKTTIQPKK